ncbi:transaldolase/EF-hand domain-containing protein [Roseimaritima ulvae]|uniref:Transaldolase/EF-hand domain-containing protein n=2 Tax=Roseimaritima ulvae TaxID=980254 RepID=A0A5B9QL05_9BACT|nr:transaldolase/EF-hand domain-containing protein [Roseimaritima ulvae]
MNNSLRTATAALLTAILSPTMLDAHEGHSHAPSPQAQKKIIRLNTETPQVHLVVQRRPADTVRPDLAKLFDPFKGKVDVRFDRDYLFVESNGMPDHSMMTGITAWQQQVPLPQSYTGGNAWTIPLHPVPAKNPLSTKEHFFRGAIALAVNGVPIFNPIKNDGKTDTLKAGELDQWGGHCGRADDYHYHIAPVHLEKIVGAGNPVAVALDGYPIYGYNDPNGKPPTDLDWLNGHKGPDGKYHYHATKQFPYLNGGFYGEVVERDGQVDPQPRAGGVRPALRGLKGAKIVGFENPKPNSYVVHYEVFGDKRSVEYTVADNGSVTFNFVSSQGTQTENYTPRQRGAGGGNDRRNTEPPTGRQPQGNRGRADEGRGEVERRGGDPIVKALDSNGDGRINKAELRAAAQALRTLDSNKDGQVTAEEIRRPGGQRQGGEGGGPQRRQPGQAGGPRGPQPGDGPRQPWILVHADEIDLDKDKIISRDEIVGEATKAFAGYDTNNDGKLSQAELSVRGGSRSAMGGFLKGHSKEIDRDGDGILTRTEAIGNAERMFAKMDGNKDGKISATEMEASRR